jgi:hypothetical protein
MSPGGPTRYLGGSVCLVDARVRPVGRHRPPAAPRRESVPPGGLDRANRTAELCFDEILGKVRIDE